MVQLLPSRRIFVLQLYSRQVNFGVVIRAPYISLKYIIDLAFLWW